MFVKNVAEDSQKKGTDAPRQVVRFGAHRFTHAFYSADEPQFLACWKIIYAQITLTSHQVNFYKWALQKYTKYPQYDTQTLISDYLHSQWNQDIFLPYSPSTMSFLVTQLQENLGQLPTLFQRDHQLPPTKLKDFPVLFYSPLSGWGGSYCPFKAPILKLLPELTNSFNAYDRLFCDAFDALNVTFTVSYNFGEFRWVRSFLLRDDLVSAFLPDPGALFYASPGITFVILKEHPILWNNVLRPFTPLVWGATIAAFSAYILSQEVFAHVGRLMSAPRSRSASIISKPQNTLELITSFGQLILTMAYSGMVLVGLLLPVYSWSPRTFQELNKTKRIFGATSYATAIDPHRLISTEVLNGITLWKDREVEREKKLTPGMYLHDDEQDEQTRYALLMDDDKKSLFIYGRSELRHTAKYINRLESARESVLQEMRYVSVAPSATKLHGVVATLKKLFQSGSWLRWKYLEDNYYKFVAPSLVLKQLNERCDSTEGLRSLKLADISTTFIMLGTALGISGICFFVETTFKWILNKLQSTKSPYTNM